MNLEDIRNKYQCDEGRTFAQWKEWVRKNKPSQAQAHIVKAVAPNGSKYERLIGGYTDAQNTASNLVSHGYKDVKLYHSVNAGPMKLLRNFSAPLHGAKFKDSVDSVDSIREKYAMDAAMGIKISGNEKGTERLTMEKVFKEWLSPAAAWQKVKKGNTIMIRFNGNGPNKKLKGKDVLKIEYFNPNVVAMTPRSGGTQLVGLQRINVMAGKLASEGLRSYPEFENMLLKKDSADDFASDAVDEIRQKYQEDKLSITSKGFANGSGVLKKDTRKGLKPFEVAFFVKGKDGKPFKTVRSKMAASLEEAKRWANQESRKYNGVTKVEVKEFKDEADCVELIRAKYSTDAYDLGISKKEIDPKAPLKVLSVTAKKEPDGISGSVSFTKGNKKVSERFMVYNSGNWDKKPFGSSAYGYSASDRETLMNAVRNKLSTMGIKAK